jgi:hypothetical protein
MIFSYFNSPLLMHQKCYFAVQPQTAAEGFCPINDAVSFMNRCNIQRLNQNALPPSHCGKRDIPRPGEIIDLIYSVAVEFAPKFHLPFLTLYTWLQGVSTI